MYELHRELRPNCPVCHGDLKVDGEKARARLLAHYYPPNIREHRLIKESVEFVLEHTNIIKPIEVKPKPSNPDGLTKREVEVVKLIAQGMQDKEIAHRLNGISINTLARHRTHIFAKTGATNRVEVTLYAIEKRIIPIPRFSAGRPFRS